MGEHASEWVPLPFKGCASASASAPPVSCASTHTHTPTISSAHNWLSLCLLWAGLQAHPGSLQALPVLEARARLASSTSQPSPTCVICSFSVLPCHSDCGGSCFKRNTCGTRKGGQRGWAGGRRSSPEVHIVSYNFKPQHAADCRQPLSRLPARRTSHPQPSQPSQGGRGEGGLTFSGFRSCHTVPVTWVRRMRHMPDGGCSSCSWPAPWGPLAATHGRESTRAHTGGGACMPLYRRLPSEAKRTHTLGHARRSCTHPHSCTGGAHTHTRMCAHTKELQTGVRSRVRGMHARAHSVSGLPSHTRAAATYKRACMHPGTHARTHARALEVHKLTHARGSGCMLHAAHSGSMGSGRARGPQEG